MKVNSRPGRVESMKVPFKRGTNLDYVGPHFPHGPCKYVRWWGIMRSSLIVARFPDGRETTVHINDVKETP